MRHSGEAMGEEEEDQFQRLPDDVVVNIFDKVSDIKWLCRCFMVSKRFSSLVPLVETVSIKTEFPSEIKNPHGNGFLGQFSKFLIDKVLKPLDYFHMLEPPSSESICSNCSNGACCVFIRNLKQIRFINYEFVTTWNAMNDVVFKLGAKFTTKHASVSFLCAASLSKIMEPEEEEEVEVEELRRRFRYAYWWVVMWLQSLSTVVPRHQMLQSITISDSINKGLKCCLGGEKLVEYRNACNLGRITLADASWVAQNTRTGYVPVLQLPMSGYVMKGATIMNVKLYGDDDYEANSAVLDAFAEEEGVFLEALEQILEHYRDGIKA